MTSQVVVQGTGVGLSARAVHAAVTATNASVLHDGLCHTFDTQNAQLIPKRLEWVAQLPPPSSIASVL